jgi:hypothetical protein
LADSLRWEVPYLSTGMPDSPTVDADGSTRRTILGVLASISGATRDGRNMQLEEYNTRALQVGELHELVFSARSAPPTIEDVVYIGFFEVTQGGVARKGDWLFLRGERVGSLIGFDYSHYPNHINLVFEGNAATGVALGLRLDDPVAIRGI